MRTPEDPKSVAWCFRPEEAWCSKAPPPSFTSPCASMSMTASLIASAFGSAPFSDPAKTAGASGGGVRSGRGAARRRTESATGTASAAASDGEGLWRRAYRGQHGAADASRLANDAFQYCGVQAVVGTATVCQNNDKEWMGGLFTTARPAPTMGQRCALPTLPSYVAESRGSLAAARPHPLATGSRTRARMLHDSRRLRLRLMSRRPRDGLLYSCCYWAVFLCMRRATYAC
eukprot:351487-Chlamydomonas_euryale.AAC.2